MWINSALSKFLCISRTKVHLQLQDTYTHLHIRDNYSDSLLLP